MERRAEFFNKISFVFFLICFIWTLLLFIAPFALPTGSVNDLSGLVAVCDNEHQISTMPFPWNSIYSSGDRLCHQIADRSFYLNGNEMPFCSRCTAIFVGLTVGLGFIAFYKIELDERFIALIFIGIMPLGIDGIGQLFGFWESTNLIRVITGILTGIVCGISIGLIIDELKMIFAKKG